MNLSDLIEELKECIHEYDTGIDLDTQLVNLINEAQQQISEEIEVATLRKMNVVQTDVTAPYLTMPSDFSGRLKYLGNAYGPIELYKNGLEGMLKDYPSLDEVGDVVVAAVDNNLLYYQGIPSTPAYITVLYYASPKTLALPHDIPEWLPEYLHRGLLVNKAAEIKYRSIEEGVEGEMVNTQKYRGYYEESKSLLELWLSRRRSHVGTSVWAD